MINLIPNQEKKKMVRGFYYKLAVLFFAMLSFSALVATLALLPAYFFSNSKKNIANAKLEAQKAQSVTLFDQETKAVIQDINNKLSVIENAEKNKFLVSEKIIDTIFSKKVSSIKITQISFKADLNNEKKISVSGTAPSREVLLSFRRSLEMDPSFKSVDLPISNFVKDANIQFYLTLTPA